MFDKNLILKNWLQQKEVFIDNVIISRKRPTKDSVHDLRVAVKKMRSYLRLNEEVTKEDWKDSFTGIRNLFKTFGKLRDFDISLQLCRRYERQNQLPVSAFKEYLSVNRSLLRRWVKDAAKNIHEQQPVFDRQFSYFNELFAAEASQKIIELSIEIIKKIKRGKKHFKKNAHEIRKLLKDVVYWLKIIPKSVKAIDLKPLDRLLTYLGTWQDHFIFIRMTKQYAKAFVNTKDEKNVLMELIKKAGLTQKDLLTKAINKWDELEKRITPLKETPPLALSNP
jgi:CHAD domain-containing protein